MPPVLGDPSGVVARGEADGLFIVDGCGVDGGGGIKLAGKGALFRKELIGEVADEEEGDFAIPFESERCNSLCGSKYATEERGEE